jgi:hypothetical protein
MQKLGPWVSVRFGAVLQHLTGPSGSLWRNRARHRQWRETANPANEAEANRFPKRNFGSVTVTVAPGASRWPTFGKNFWVHIAVLEPQNIPKCQGWQLMAMSKYVKICQVDHIPSAPSWNVLKASWPYDFASRWNLGRFLGETHHENFTCQKGTVPEVS